MCTRQQALRRLTGRWLEEVARDPATVHCMPLRAVLIEENIRATQALDLYADYDDFGERQRGREMIRNGSRRGPTGGRNDDALDRHGVPLDWPQYSDVYCRHLARSPQYQGESTWMTAFHLGEDGSHAVETAS